MNTLAERYQDQISGIISCFDRVIISGTLPNICHASAMACYLNAVGIKLFEFTTWANKLRDELRNNAERIAKEAGVATTLTHEFVMGAGRCGICGELGVIDAMREAVF